MSGRREISGFYSTGQAAKVLDMSPRTVLEYCRNGKIKAKQHPVTNQWIIADKDLKAFLKSKGIKPPDALDGKPDMEPEQKSPRVLVVDDEIFVRNAIKRHLDIENIETCEAADGEKGFELANSQIFDLILLDLQMPKVNGPKFIEKMHEVYNRTPIIIITGYPDSDLVAKAMNYGPITLVPKPFTRQTLLKAVYAVLDRPRNK